MRPVALDEIYWPVFRHSLTLSVQECSPLDVLEEGLVRFVGAGVDSATEAAKFLGCSTALVTKMSATLAQSFGGQVEPAIRVEDAALYATAATASVLLSCQRAVIVQREVNLLRDAVFDGWVDLGEQRFQCASINRNVGSCRHWLGPIAVSSAATISSAVDTALQGAAKECEIVSYTVEEVGDLQWVPLRLVLFQSIDFQTGRLLLFNPSNDDQPLSGLSADFEQLLRSSSDVPLYFGDDLGGTARAFWEALSNRLKSEQRHAVLRSTKEDLSSLEGTFEEVKAVIESQPPPVEDLRKLFWTNITSSGSQLKRGDAQAAAVFYRDAVSGVVLVCGEQHLLSGGTILELANQLRSLNVIAPDQFEILLFHARNAEEWNRDVQRPEMGGRLTQQLPAAVAGLKLLARELGLGDGGGADHARVVELQQVRVAEIEINKKRAEVERLQQLLSAMPLTRHIDTKEHPEILRSALANARSTVILVLPWLKMRVLSKYLGHIRSALERGCEIWIGYGMPPNEFHRDSSDAAALKTLEDCARGGGLYVVELGTHEKVLIQDDCLFVTTSFNWLSYDGTDRRESGLLQEGNVAKYRDKFLAVLKEQHVKNSMKTDRRSTAKSVVHN